MADEAGELGDVDGGAADGVVPAAGVVPAPDVAPALGLAAGLFEAEASLPVIST